MVGGGGGEPSEATRRHQVEAYLAAVGPDQLGRLTTLGPRAAARELTGSLNGQGVQVSERYVQQISTTGPPPLDSRPKGDAAPADSPGGGEESAA